MSIYAKKAGVWQQIGAGGGGGAAWAKVTGGTVSTFTDPVMGEMELHTFTADGNLTVETEGIAHIFVIGGGAGGSRNIPDGANGRGGNGAVPTDIKVLLSAGTVPLKIGAGGSENGGQGGESQFGDFLKAPGASNRGGSGAGNGASGAVGGDGASDPGGAGVEFYGSWFGGGGGAGGHGGGATATPGVGGQGGGGKGEVLGSGLPPQNTTNSGVYPAMNGAANSGGGGGASGTWFSPGQSDWGRGGAGGSGCVVVAVQKSPGSPSGVQATGGTVTTYTGDGTNGVLGQEYKVHTFTEASGTLEVTAPGEADLLVVAGGGGAGPNRADGWGGGAPGGAGGLVLQSIVLSAGSHPVIVGAGGPKTASGGPSQFGSIYAYGGGVGGMTSPDIGSRPGGFGGSGGGGGHGQGGGGTGGGSVPHQGHNGGNQGTWEQPGGGGGAGGPGTVNVGGPGVTIWGNVYAQGGGGNTPRANSGDGAPGGGAGQAGVVIVRYKV